MIAVHAGRRPANRLGAWILTASAGSLLLLAGLCYFLLWGWSAERVRSCENDLARDRTTPGIFMSLSRIQDARRMRNTAQEGGVSITGDRNTYRDWREGVPPHKALYLLAAVMIAGLTFYGAVRIDAMHQRCTVEHAVAGIYEGKSWAPRDFRRSEFCNWFKKGE